MPRPWWIRSFARTLGVSRRSVSTFQPRLDTLEDRATPAVITLNNSTNPAKLSIVLDADNEELTIQSIGSGKVEFTTTGTFSGGATGSATTLTVVPGFPVELSVTDAPTITFGVVKFLDSGANPYPAMPTNIALDNNSGGVQFNGTTDFGSSTLSVTGDTTISLKPSAVILTTTDLTLDGDRLDIQNATPAIPGSTDAYINAGTATVRIGPASAGQEINIGGDDFSGFLGLTDDELDRITAGAIEIGNATAGNAKITAPISPAHASKLSITTGGKLFPDPTYPGGTAITVGKLTLSTGTGAGTAADPIPTDVDNLEASGAGSVYVANSGALTIGGVSAAGGVQVTGTDAVVSVAATGTLTVNEVVKAPGDVTLEATGPASDVVFQHGVPRGVSSSSGTTRVTAGRNITIGTVNGYGDVNGQGLVLDAGGDVVVNTTSYVESNGAAGLEVTAGGDVKILQSLGGGSILNSNGGGANVSITPGTGKSFVLDQGSDGGVAANGGNVVIAADNMVLASGRVGTTGTVTLKPATAGRAISLGVEVAGQLSLTQAELDLVTVTSPPLSMGLQIGDAASGAVTVAADLTRPVATRLTLASGGVISPISSSAGAINTSGGSLTLAPGTGGYTPVRSGTDATTTAAKFASGSDLAISINGTTADTGYTRFVASGSVDLAGADLVLSGSYNPVYGDVFTIVSAASVDNEFNGFSEGGTVSFGGRLLRVHYGAAAVTLSVVDETAPDTEILTGPSGSTNDTTPTFTFTGTDTESGVASYEVSVDGGTPVVVTGTSYTTPALGDGPHTISVAAVDAEGNVDSSPATRTFSTTGVAILIGPPSVAAAGVGALPVTYTVSYADTLVAPELTARDVRLNRTGSARGTVTVTQVDATTFTVTISNLRGDGTLGISVRRGTATDARGRPAPAVGPSATFVVDTVPPVVRPEGPKPRRVRLPAGVVVLDVAVTDTNFVAAALVPGDVTVVSDAGITATVSVAPLDATHFRITLTNFSAAGRVRIALPPGIATDALGNASEAAVSRWFRVFPTATV